MDNACIVNALNEHFIGKTIHKLEFFIVKTFHRQDNSNTRYFIAKTFHSLMKNKPFHDKIFHIPTGHLVSRILHRLHVSSKFLPPGGRGGPVWIWQRKNYCGYSDCGK